MLQAAGRVIRTETDRGVVLLIDKRYDAEELRALLPLAWQPRRIRRLEELTRALNEFWSEPSQA